MIKMISNEMYKEYNKHVDVTDLISVLSKKLEIEFDETKRILPNLVKCLTKKQLDIVVMYYYQGYSIVDIAIILNEGNTYSRYLDTINRSINRMVKYANTHALI